MTAFMRASDAFTWAMESDPRLRSTVVSVVLLDRSPDWDEVNSGFTTLARTRGRNRKSCNPVTAWTTPASAAGT